MGWLDFSAVRSRAPKWMVDLYDFLRYLMAEYVDTGCRHRAASLAYMSLFALVPMLTVIYSMFSIIPAFQGMGEQLQTFLLDHLLPDSGAEIQGYLSTFSSQARSLTVVGVFMLIATAYFMLKSIENAFNHIWGITKPRKGLMNFLLYWAVLSLGPLLLGIGLAMSTYLISLRLFFSEYDAIGLIPIVFNIMPWLLTTATFTLLLVAVPNCRVPLRHAIIGGFLTALGFELLKDLFGWVISHSSYQVVYGAFAMVPLFLLWMNLVWTVVLSGALVVRSLSTYQQMLLEKDEISDLAAAISILWLFYQRNREGGVLSDADILTAGINAVQWQRLKFKLQDQRLIAVTAKDDFVLSRDLACFSLFNLVELLNLSTQVNKGGLPKDWPWGDRFMQLVQGVNNDMSEQLDIPLARLFESTGSLKVVSQQIK